MLAIKPISVSYTHLDVYKRQNLGLGLMALLALSSCADDKFSEYRTDMTKNLKDYQYLNNYEPLKKYVDVYKRQLPYL